MDNHAEYFRQCIRAALGRRSDEPIGYHYDLHYDEAVTIADSAWRVLEEAGIPTKPRWQPANGRSQQRLTDGYLKAGKRAPLWDSVPY